ESDPPHEGAEADRAGGRACQDRADGGTSVAPGDGRCLARALPSPRLPAAPSGLSAVPHERSDHTSFVRSAFRDTIEIDRAVRPRLGVVNCRLSQRAAARTPTLRRLAPPAPEDARGRLSMTVTVRMEFRWPLVLLAALVAAVGACAGADGGGSSGATGGGSASGGSPGSGGTTASGGAPGKGGAVGTTGTGGATSSGGTPGSGGATAAGGSPASGCGSGDASLPAEPTLPSSVCMTLPASKSVSATAIPSESNADTSAIQSALNGCGSGKAVKLTTSGSNNAFLTGPLKIPTGVTLWVDTGTTLYGMRDPKVYGSASALITVSGANSGIVGDGVIDGQGGEPNVGSSQSWWDQNAGSS